MLVSAPDGDLDDVLIWKATADGLFSIRTTYDVLSKHTDDEPADVNFTALWKLRTPPRINTFLWRVAYQRLMTNSEHLSRGIAVTSLSQ